jgi:thiamine-monophosphate kinase
VGQGKCPCGDNVDMKKVSELGEFGLIDRLGRMVAEATLQPPTAAGFRLRLGIGDDAAVWHISPGLIVSTTDTVVEGVHFTLETTPWSDLGWKVMVASLSDVAAMGAAPLCAMVTLGLPGEAPVSAVEDLYQGMLEACQRYRLLLIGGDVVSSANWFVTVALDGVCSAEPLVRSAARPGDAIAVTGPLGGSAGGLRLLQSGASIDNAAASELVRAHRRPEPRLDEGQRLLRSGVRCAMDISDGLVADLSKLCRASGVGAHVQAVQVPLDSALSQVFSHDALQMALNGGEEYELLFAGHPSVVQRVVSELPRATLIGEVTVGEPGRVMVTDDQGREMELASTGWDHLRG